MTSTDRNIAWLQERGYEMILHEEKNESFWIKNHVSISIHSLQGIDHEYFKAWTTQKEKDAPAYQFQVIEPNPTLFGPEPSKFNFESI